MKNISKSVHLKSELKNQTSTDKKCNIA